MATLFKTKVVKNIGTTPVDALQTVENNRFTIIGCNLANTIDDPVTIDLYVIDSTSTVGYYVKGLLVPANTSLKVVTNGEKIILAEQCGLRIVSNYDDSIDATISYAEIV
jgi:hypothetical protein